MLKIFKRNNTNIQTKDDTDTKVSLLVNNTHTHENVATQRITSNYADTFNFSDSSNYESDDDNQDTVTLKSLLWNIVQMVIYCADIFSDSFLAISYAVQGKYLYSVLTLAVVYIAAGIDAYFNRSELKIKGNRWKYTLTLLLNIRGLAVYKQFVTMRYQIYRGVNSVKETQEDFFDRNFRVANLKLHEGLFEACPQLLLQLYIMLANIEDNINITLFIQNLSILISLCSLAMTFITGDTARRLYEHEKDNFSKFGVALQFFWIFPITASRILALSCVTSIYPISSVACFGFHGLISFIYLRYRHPYTSFGALVAAIRVFLTPYEPIEQYDNEFTRRLQRSHMVHFIGNIFAIVTWVMSSELATKRFSVFIIILFFLIFGCIVGMISLTLLMTYKDDCFVQEGETISAMDRRLQPYLDGISELFGPFKKGFRILKYRCCDIRWNK